MLCERGFSLVELLIAVSIFSIGVLAVATMQISAIGGNRFGNEVSQATYLGQEKIEELKNSTDIAAEADGNDQQGIFNRSWQITPVTGNSQQVTVTVAWTVGGGNHDVVLSTITGGNGI
jgi:type IV pilus assembly protein PilV